MEVDVKRYFLTVFFLSTILICSATFHDVLINEFNTEVLWGSSMGGVDGKLELKNNTGATVDFAGWYIAFPISIAGYGGGEYVQDLTSLGTLASGALVSFDMLDGTYGGSLAEGGGYIKLYDGLSNLIDEVYYGTAGGAPDPGVRTSATLNPFSCERVGTTGDHAKDWEWQKTPTFGSANNRSVPLLGQGVIINEAYLKSGDSTSYIELLNITSSTINISGWRILVDTVANTFPTGTYLAAYSLTTVTKDFALYQEGSGETSFDTSTIYLIDNNGRRHDQIGWEALSASGENFSRVSDGYGGYYDGFNRSTCGFKIAASSGNTKGSFNVPLTALTLSEVFLKTGGLIELEIRNNQAYDINISSFKVNNDLFKTGTIIEAGAYKVFYSTDFTDTLDNTYITAGSGTIALKNAFDAGIYSFSYGYTGGAPDLLKDYSLAKVQATGTASSDWTVDFTPTPGAANDAPVPVLGNTVTVNEVNPHPGAAFIEIYNNSASAADISGFKIICDSILAIPASTTVNSYSFYVIEQSSFPAGFNLTSVDGQTHSNIYMYDDTGVRIDQIGWEAACSFTNNSYQRDDDDVAGWLHNGYNVFTSNIICQDDSKGFKNIPDCNYDTTAPDWPTSGMSDIAAVGDYYRILISWGAASDAENTLEYTLYRSVNDTASYSPIATGVMGDTYSDNAVSKDNVYYYYIEAENCFGLSKKADDSASASPLTYTLKDIRAHDDNGMPLLNNQNVDDIIGVVNVPTGIFQTGKCSFFFEQDGYGVNIFGYSELATSYDVGDIISVSGQITAYNGTTEIVVSGDGDVTKIGTAVMEPAETQIFGTDLEEIEGTLITMRGYICDKIKIYAPNSGYFYITDGFGKVEVYCSDYDSTDIDLNIFKMGMLVEVTGILLQYDKTTPYTSGYELKPRYASDMVILSGYEFDREGPADNIINPYEDETTNINFNAVPGSTTTIRIYDLRGKVVRTLIDANMGSGSIAFDGKDDEGKPLRIGTYIVNVYTADDEGITVKNFPVIIAIPLK